MNNDLFKIKRCIFPKKGNIEFNSFKFFVKWIWLNQICLQFHWSWWHSILTEKLIIPIGYGGQDCTYYHEYGSHDNQNNATIGRNKRSTNSNSRSSAIVVGFDPQPFYDRFGTTCRRWALIVRHWTVAGITFSVKIEWLLVSRVWFVIECDAWEFRKTRLQF